MAAASPRAVNGRSSAGQRYGQRFKVVKPLVVAGSRSSRPSKAVSDATDGVDEPWRRGLLLDLAAEPVNVNVDRPGLTRVVVAPDALEELVAGEHLTGMTQQEDEQLEGLRLDRQGVAVAEQPMAGDVDLDAPEIDDRRRVLGRDSLFGASEERPDPGR